MDILPSLWGVRAVVSANSNTDRCCRLDSLEKKKPSVKRQQNASCFNCAHCSTQTTPTTEKKATACRTARPHTAELAQGKESAQNMERKNQNKTLNKTSPAQPDSKSDTPAATTSFAYQEGHFRWICRKLQVIKDTRDTIETYSVSTGTSDARHWLAHLMR